jgi:ribosomal protein S18 acetylase RimI-like enzyme
MTIPASEIKDRSLRRMLEADVPAADVLRRLAGWNQTPADWHRLLWLEPEGCFVAMEQGRLVGTVTTITHGRTLGWIGMMLVHPNHRRQGIATRLMRQALAYLQSRGVKCIKLDATPDGRLVYDRLGFSAEGTITRHRRTLGCEPALPESALASVRNLCDADWDRVEEIDTAVFGAQRSRLIRCFAHANATALVWCDGDRVGGWGLLRPGADAEYLGPVICFNSTGSLALVSALARKAGNRPVIWDVPDCCKAAEAAALRLGFTRERSLIRMRLGQSLVVNHPGAQFAIADPSVG